MSDSDGVNRSDRHPESLHYPPALEAAVCDKARGVRISIEAQGSCPAEAGYMFATFLHFIRKRTPLAVWTCRLSLSKRSNRTMTAVGGDRPLID